RAIRKKRKHTIPSSCPAGRMRTETGPSFKTHAPSWPRNEQMLAGCPAHSRFSNEGDLQRPFLAVDPHLPFFTAGISSETAHSQSLCFATRPHFNNCR